MQLQNRAVLLMLCLGCGTAAAWQLPQDAQVHKNEDCARNSEVCVKYWADMTAQERATLWPYLDEVTRVHHWRGMTVSERQEMREKLSDSDKERLRRRFALRREDMNNGYAGTEEKAVKLGRLCVEDRTLLREQIRDFHVERVGNSPQKVVKPEYTTVP